MTVELYFPGDYEKHIYSIFSKARRKWLSLKFFFFFPQGQIKKNKISEKVKLDYSVQ